MNTNSLLQTLEKAGHRVTTQRKAICEFLASSEAHPSAQMIYDHLKPRFGTLSLATVYNTLDILARMGAINELGAVGDAARYDADTEPHVNLACVNCHRILDIPSSHVQQLNGEVAEASGFQLLGARVLYYGLCPDCQTAANQRQDPTHKED